MDNIATRTLSIFSAMSACRVLPRTSKCTLEASCHRRLLSANTYYKQGTKQRMVGVWKQRFYVTERGRQWGMINVTPIRIGLFRNDGHKRWTVGVGVDTKWGMSCPSNDPQKLHEKNTTYGMAYSVDARVNGACFVRRAFRYNKRPTVSEMLHYINSGITSIQLKIYDVRFGVLMWHKISCMVPSFCRVLKYSHCTWWYQFRERVPAKGIIS